MMAVRWLEKLETTIDEGRGTHTDEQASLERRIVALEVQVADLSEWLTAVSDDMLTRTAGVGPALGYMRGEAGYGKVETRTG
jgi:hypothetical protein